LTGGARVQGGEVRAEAAVVVGGLGVFGFVEAEELVVFGGAQPYCLLDGPGNAEREDVAGGLCGRACSLGQPRRFLTTAARARAALTRTQAVSAAFTSAPRPRSVAGRAVGDLTVIGRTVGGRAARVTSSARFHVACVTVAAEYSGLETRLFPGELNM
jgi:hypothetical protein